MPTERKILESDWKLFRSLRELALDRFCQRVLGELNQLAADTSKSNHERYLAIYRMIQERDEELAAAFNDLRRSTAIANLARMRYHELLTDEEFARFSPETRSAVEFFVDMWRS